MAATKYSYAFSEFATDKVNSDRLKSEIQASAIVTALDHIDTADASCDIWFKDELASGDETILAGLVTAHAGQSLAPEPIPVRSYSSGDSPAPTTADGRYRTASEKTDQNKLTICTHDWTDPTTWYTDSVRVADETATDEGAHTTYSLEHENVIDTYHGKLFGEDFLKDSSDHSYRVAVKVNGTTKTEQDPHAASGGDYVVGYAAGTVTFLSALGVDDVVTVTYHYAVGSDFVIEPKDGKEISIDFVEVQFSEDVEMLDSVIFQPEGLVDYYAPQLLQANGGPYAPGTIIPLGDPVIYKSFTDLQADAVRSYPAYPAFGGTGWRGSTKSILIMDWDYVSATKLESKSKTQIRMKLQHDVPFGGWYATATFYTLIQDDD